MEKRQIKAMADSFRIWQFMTQAVQWHVDWIKAGRPQSNQGMK